MISFNHEGYVHSDEHVRANLKLGNKILIVLRNNEDEIEISTNRNLFTKRCGSEELKQACSNGDDQIILNCPYELIVLLNQKQNKDIFIKFLIYLASGNIEFSIQNFNVLFLLVCAFKAKEFIHSLIDQKINLPFDNQQSKRIMFHCSFDYFNDFLNEDSKHNFIFWIFKKFPKHTNLNSAKTIFQEDISLLESYIIEFVSYKVKNQILNDGDIDDLLMFYSSLGRNLDEAKLKVKRLIQWENISVEILDANRRGLKFTDEEMRKILQKRLNRLCNTKVENADQQLIQLREKRDFLKKQYQDLLDQQHQYQIKKESLIKGGTNKQPTQQNPKKSEYKPIQEQKYFTQNQNDEQLLNQCNIMLNSRGNIPSNYINPPSPPSNSQLPHKVNNGNSRIPHLQQNPYCGSSASVRLACGCEVCVQCLIVRYIQKTEKYEEIQNPVFKPTDFKRYGLYCYNCNTLMSQGDAEAFNNAPKR